MTVPLHADPSFLNQRREAISRNPSQIGIDYVGVQQQTASTWLLSLYFIPADPDVRGKNTRPEPPLDAGQITITGVSSIGATNVQVLDVTYPNQGNLVQITIGLADGGAGDRALPRYQLQLDGVRSLDPFFTSVTFSLSTVVSADFGPQPSPVAPSPTPAPPPIDYLTKDYASFRQLMLDRLAFLIPDWNASSPADVGVTLVEVMAYGADQLSYFQDAVATEAYLETARQRISVRRHARLLDYTMHEGCNARVWVHFDVNADAYLERGTALLTNPNLETMAPRLDDRQYEQAVNQGTTVFETMHGAHLCPGQTLWLYTWGAPELGLPAGATSATLLVDSRYVPAWRGEPRLRVGDVLIFEQVSVMPTATPLDLAARHAVRLTSVEPASDPLGVQISGRHDLDALEPVQLLSITWASDDALPSAFPVARLGSFGGHVASTRTTVARGNVVLADHGRRVAAEDLPTVEDGRTYRPVLDQPNLTYRVAYDDTEARTQPAIAATVQDPRAALPALRLRSQSGVAWRARRDLLSSTWSSRDFVVEMESDRTAHLRFGDNTYGDEPTIGERFMADYRVGNGIAGNVGADTIAHYHGAELTPLTGDHGPILSLTNLLPAQGGVAPEPLEQVRLNAPQALHLQDRCVTEADFAAVAERFPGVRQAKASRIWTGSWPTVFLAINRQDGRPVDDAFRRQLGRFMQPFLLLGTDLKIVPPNVVSLEIVLRVYVRPGQYPDFVRQQLLEAFSSTPLPDGRHGFFESSRFTFGQPVYLSQVVACAYGVAGVDWVEAERFGRWHDGSQQGLVDEQIAIGPTEIARLENDPNAPELGQISFTMVESARR